MTIGTSTPSAQTRSTGSQCVELCYDLADTPLAIFDAINHRQSALRILVLKLDHLGDFLIGVPALVQLRATFPDAHITLICGPWNVATAQQLGVANQVIGFSLFPENAQGWDGKVADDIFDRFREICAGTFDIAIDLRVDEDTRHLLTHIEATLRCGIGSRQKHPFLNVLLPREFERRETALPGSEGLFMRPDAFHSRMATQTPFYHETDFSITDTHLIYGPYCQLPLGRLRAELAYQMTSPTFWSPRVRMTIDVVRDDRPEPAAILEVSHVPKSKLFRFDVVFSNDNPYARFEIRTFVGGRPWCTRLRFFGVRLDVLKAPEARYRPAELHIGESLSLLVRLIAERVRPLYALNLADRLAGRSDTMALTYLQDVPRHAKCIVIAPFSNSQLRNWPLDRFGHLISMILASIDSYVLLVGSSGQAQQLMDLQQRLGDNPRLINLAGRVDWAGLAKVMGRADLVVANNSGVAHLAAACGTPTLAIYSGSHQPQEWGPRGRMVRALMATVPCSPCGHDTLEACSHEHLCMTLIEPENVLRNALDMLNRMTPSQERANRPFPP